MKKIRRIIGMSMLLLAGAGVSFAETYSDRIESMKNHGDLAGLQDEYDRLVMTEPRDAAVLYRLGKTESSLLSVREYADGDGAKAEKTAFESIDWCKQAIAKGTLSKEDMADSCYIICEMYNYMIRDAASWMQYNAGKEKYFKLCVMNNPDHLGARLMEAATLLNMPASAGGDPARGRELLNALYAENPENLSVLGMVADDFKNRKDLASAADIYGKMLSLYPEYAYAQEMLDEFSLIERELTIADIRIEGDVKTSESRILKKTASFIGKKYSYETKEAIRAEVLEISSITGCEIVADIAGDTAVSLRLALSENNMKMIAAIGGLGLSLDYDKDELSANPLPAAMYMDSNFLGTADSFSMIFAGIYLSADYVHHGLIDDGFADLTLSWKSMFLGQGSTPVAGGIEQDGLGIRSPYHSATIGLVKDFPFGLSASVNANAQYRNWKKSEDNDSSDFILPEHHVTYNPYVDLSFSTIGGSSGSKLDLLDGFSIQMTPEMVYQQGYRDWGKEGDLYEHDGNPAWRFSALFEYDKKLSERQNLRLNLNYKTGMNMYETEKWSVGQSDLLSSDACLDGYYPGEFEYTTGSLANIMYQVNVVPSMLALYAKCDAFWNFDDDSLYRGAALGVTAKLPFGVELTGQTGIGLDAERESGFGYEFNMLLMKIWML